MNFLRKNWYYLGGGLCLALAVLLIFIWGSLGILQRILYLSFMALLLHQFEEYALPGGFPAVMNLAWMHKAGTLSDRYPLNRRAAFFVNVLFAYPYYVLPILLPGQYWMGLGQVAFGMAQFVIHGIVINRKFHSLYNPGLAVVVFMHIPIGIYYIWYAVSHRLITWWDWPLAALWLAAGAVVGVALPVTSWFADKNTPYAFSKAEMGRFHVAEKMKRSHRA